MVAILVLIFNSICLKSFSKQMFTFPPISMMRSIELTCQRQNTINCLLHPEGRDWPTKTLEDTSSVGLQWELVWTYFQRQINQQKSLLFKEFLPSASLLSWAHFSSKPPLQSSKKNYFQENIHLLFVVRRVRYWNIELDNQIWLDKRNLFQYCCLEMICFNMSMMQLLFRTIESYSMVN